MKTLSAFLFTFLCTFYSPITVAVNTSFCATDCKYEFNMFRTYARQGSSLAKLNLGIMYIQGKGTERNIESGIRYISNAAQDKEPAAAYQLGYMYLFGMYVKQDIERAKVLLKKAQVRGVVDAGKYLKFIEQSERGVSQTVNMNKDHDIEKKKELAKEIKKAEQRAREGDMEVIVVDGRYDYTTLVEAAKAQACTEKSCGPKWHFVLMPIIKLTPVVEQILFGKAASYARFFKSQTA